MTGRDITLEDLGFDALMIVQADIDVQLDVLESCALLGPMGEGVAEICREKIDASQTALDVMVARETWTPA